MLHNMLKHRLR